MPPALRRIASSPAVRSAAAPYPPPPPAAPASSSAARTRSGRRRGVSDPNSRRVLADIEWWRVMQGQREEDRAPEHARADEPDTGGDDDDGDVPRTRRGTPEGGTPAAQPSGHLYTLREDASAHAGHQGHGRGASDASSDDTPPSSTHSTPPRAPSLPPLDTALGLAMPTGISAPRRSRTRLRSPSGGVSIAPLSPSSSPAAGIFAPYTNTAIFAQPSVPPPHTISVSHMHADLDVGVYTAAPHAHRHRHRHRSASFPGIAAAAVDEGTAV